ncbi:MAG: hypothetical protein HY551_07765 [Elusimicrobia bacterium]|nr:hypothetical protein [Elusimicrobiota bacterium]
MSQEDAPEKIVPMHPARPTELLWMAEILSNPWRIAWLNFLAGVSRGLGFALGVGPLAGAVVVVAYKVVAHAVNLPLVGTYLAEFIAEVQKQMAQLGRMRP